VMEKLDLFPWREIDDPVHRLRLILHKRDR
jgi:hypothetical protein